MLASDNNICDDCGWPHLSCICFDEVEDYDDYEELDCTWCDGEGDQENDDPLWYGFEVDFVPCSACGGTGLRSRQTIF